MDSLVMWAAWLGIIWVLVKLVGWFFSDSKHRERSGLRLDLGISSYDLQQRVMAQMTPEAWDKVRKREGVGHKQAVDAEVSLQPAQQRDAVQREIDEKPAILRDIDEKMATPHDIDEKMAIQRDIDEKMALLRQIRADLARCSRPEWVAEEKIRVRLHELSESHQREILEAALIRSYTIVGISGHLVDQLEGAGIRTAADVLRGDLTEIYGIGRKRSRELLHWACAVRAEAPPAPSITEEEERAIRGACAEDYALIAEPAYRLASEIDQLRRRLAILSATT